MIEKFKRAISFINSHSLAKKKPITAYLRFLLWQTQSAFNKKLIVKQYLGDVRFYAKKGLHGITGNIYAGLHEFDDMGFLLHFLRAEDNFCDIGANVGAYTLLASGYIGANSITFEPVPSTFSILEKNIKLNHLQEKVSLHNMALGNQTGEIKFTSNYDTVNHVIAEHEVGENFIAVGVSKLDSFINSQPTLIKIDVEGFEKEVIEGGKKLIESDTMKAIIIELNGSGGRYNFDENEIHLYLKKVNYKPYKYDPFNRCLTEVEDFGTHNTIYIKDITFAKNRCQTAPLVKALGINF